MISRNVTIGLVISLLLWRYQDVGYIAEFEVFSLDWMNTLQQLQVDTEDPLTFGVIQIGETTWQSWGRPPFTPRTELMNLLRHVSMNDPYAILVDIEVSTPGPGVNADAAFHQFLEGYRGAPILFVKRVDTGAGDEVSRDGEIDAIVAENPNLHCVSAVFMIDESFRVRGAELFVQPGSGPALASAQWLIANDFTMSSLPENPYQRILFRLPWELEAGMSPPSVYVDSVVRPLYSIREAEGILANSQVSGEWMRGRLTIIGNSWNPVEDHYSTALRTMPGFFVLANAIHSYLSFGSVQQPPLWLTLLIETFAIVVMSLSFARFSSFAGLCLAGLFVIIAVVPVSMILLSNGVWFNLVVPILTVQLMHILMRIEERFRVVVPK